MKKLQMEQKEDARRHEDDKINILNFGGRMKKSLKITILALSMSLTPLCLAAMGGSTGSGGDALVCTDRETGEEISAMVWDYAEGEIEQGTSVDLGAPGNSMPWGEKVEIWLNRVKVFDSYLYEMLSDIYENIFVDFDILPNKPARLITPRYQGNLVELKDINDANEAIVFDQNSSCSIRQVAIQGNKMRDFEAFIKINPKYWNLMDNDSKAGLVIHELLLFYYKQYIVSDQKLTTTDDVRYFNRIIANDMLGNASLKDYLFALKDANLVHLEGIHHYQSTDSEGVTTEIVSPLVLHLDSDLQIERKEDKSVISRGRLYIDFSRPINGTKITLAKSYFVDFFSDVKNVYTNIKRGALKEDVELKLAGLGRTLVTIPLTSEKFYKTDYACGYIEFSQHMNFVAGCLSRDTVINNIHGKKFTFAKDHMFRVDESGRFKSGCVRYNDAFHSNEFDCKLITTKEFYEESYEDESERGY